MSGSSALLSPGRRTASWGVRSCSLLGREVFRGEFSGWKFFLGNRPGHLSYSIFIILHRYCPASTRTLRSRSSVIAGQTMLYPASSVLRDEDCAPSRLAGVCFDVRGWPPTAT